VHDVIEDRMNSDFNSTDTKNHNLYSHYDQSK